MEKIKKYFNSTEKNVLHLQKLIFYLLQDYQSQTTLTDKIYPNYRKKYKRKIHRNIELWFSVVKKLCEKKEEALLSKSKVRKGEVKPYQIKITGYKLNVKEYLNNFGIINLNNKEIQIIINNFNNKELRKEILDKVKFNNYKSIELLISEHLRKILKQKKGVKS